jgi:hypothetical protein
LIEHGCNILESIKNSVKGKKRNFTGSVLSEEEKNLLGMACDYYVIALDKDKQELFKEQLTSFMETVSKTIVESLDKQVHQKNRRIHEIVELIMTYYFDYLRSGIKHIAPELNLNIGDYLICKKDMPGICFNLAQNAELKKDTKIRKWAILGAGVAFLFATPVAVSVFATSLVGLFNPEKIKKLPDAESIYKTCKEQLNKQVDSLVEPMIYLKLLFKNKSKF